MSLREFIVMALGLVSLGSHCFLQLSSAVSVVLLVPGCCWPCSAFCVTLQLVHGLPQCTRHCSHTVKSNVHKPRRLDIK